MDKVQLKMLLAIPLDQPIPYLVSPQQLVAMLATTDEASAGLWQEAVQRGLENRLLEATRSVQYVKVKPRPITYRIPQPGGCAMVRVREQPEKTQEVETISIDPKAAMDWLKAIAMLPAPTAVQLWLECNAELGACQGPKESTDERNLRWAQKADAAGRRHGAKQMVAEEIAAKESVKVDTVLRGITSGRQQMQTKSPQPSGRQRVPCNMFPV